MLFYQTVFGPTHITGPNIVWTKIYGTANMEIGFSIHHTKDDGFIIVGETKLSESHNWDIYLIKTDGEGNVIWTKTYGNENDDFGRSVIQTPEGGYTIGGFTKSYTTGSVSIYLIKTNAKGDTIWTRTYGGKSTGYICYDVLLTPDSSYIIAGTIFENDNEDIYVMKINSTGEIIWTRTYGGADQDWCWEIQQTTDNGYAIIGTTSSFGIGDSDVWLLKTDSLGDTLWTKTYGGTNWDHGLSVHQIDNDGYIIAGQTNSFCTGGPDVWLIKTNCYGDTLWTKNYGGTGNDAGYSVLQTQDEGYIIVGNTDSFGTGTLDGYIIKTNANGERIWSALYGGDNISSGASIIRTRDKGFIIIGNTTSFSNNNRDIYALKILFNPR